MLIKKNILLLSLFYFNFITFSNNFDSSNFPIQTEEDQLNKYFKIEKISKKENENIDKVIKKIGSYSNFDPEIIFKQINLKSNIDILDLPYTGTLPKSSTEINSFRIAIDYSNSNNINFLQLIFLRVFIIPQALQRIASVVRIKKREKLKFPLSKIMKCDDEFINVPEYIINKEIDADILLFVGTKKLDSETFAMTAACSISDISKRNIAANVIYHIDFLDYSKQNIEEAVETVEHELIHALVFDIDTFDRFPLTKSNKKISFRDKFNRFYLRSDFLIEELQDFFQCKLF